MHSTACRSRIEAEMRKSEGDNEVILKRDERMPGERRGEEEEGGGRPSNDGIEGSTRTGDAGIPEYVPDDVEENDDKDGTLCEVDGVNNRIASRCARERGGGLGRCPRLKR